MKERKKSLLLSLTKEEINSALRKIEKSLDTYIWLQNNLHKCDVSEDKIYQRKFTGFYKIRRDKAWLEKFYDLLQVKKKFKNTTFSLMLFILFARFYKNGKLLKKIEASFASKFVATINPHLPIIDKYVLKNIGLRLPASYEGTKLQRLNKTIVLYEEISKIYSEFLASKDGKYLIAQFKKKYPNKKISKVKMLDFVLWQIRN